MKSKDTVENDKKEYVQMALDHLWMHARSWEDMTKPDGIKIITEGDGTRLTDIDGNSYFDLMAGLWLVKLLSHDDFFF